MALPEANSGGLSVYLRNSLCSADGTVGLTTCVPDHLLRSSLASHLSLPHRTWLLLEVNWSLYLRVPRLELILRMLFRPTVQVSLSDC
jgi:hypothetical protein